MTSTRRNGSPELLDMVVLIGACLCLIGYADCPVMSGRPSRGKSVFGDSAHWSGAVMSPAFRPLVVGLDEVREKGPLSKRRTRSARPDTECPFPRPNRFAITSSSPHPFVDLPEPLNCRKPSTESRSVVEDGPHYSGDLVR